MSDLSQLKTYKPLTLRCGHCNGEISAENINFQAQLAKCTDCDRLINDAKCDQRPAPQVQEPETYKVNDPIMLQRLKLAKRKRAKLVPNTQITGTTIVSSLGFSGVLFLFLGHAHFAFLFSVFLAILIGLQAIRERQITRKFEASRKHTTRATIVDRKVYENGDGLKGISYAYSIIYAFEIPNHGIFVFSEGTNKEAFEQIHFGEQILITYVIDNPPLVRRCLGMRIK